MGSDNIPEGSPDPNETEEARFLAWWNSRARILSVKAHIASVLMREQANADENPNESAAVAKFERRDRAVHFVEPEEEKPSLPDAHDGVDREIEMQLRLLDREKFQLLRRLHAQEKEAINAKAALDSTRRRRSVDSGEPSKSPREISPDATTEDSLQRSLTEIEETHQEEVYQLKAAYSRQQQELESLRVSHVRMGKEMMALHATMGLEPRPPSSPHAGEPRREKRQFPDKRQLERGGSFTNGPLSTLLAEERAAHKNEIERIRNDATFKMDRMKSEHNQEVVRLRETVTQLRAIMDKVSDEHRAELSKAHQRIDDTERALGSSKADNNLLKKRVEDAGQGDAFTEPEALRHRIEVLEHESEFLRKDCDAMRQSEAETLKIRESLQAALSDAESLRSLLALARRDHAETQAARENERREHEEAEAARAADKRDLALRAEEWMAERRDHELERAQWREWELARESEETERAEREENWDATRRDYHSQMVTWEVTRREYEAREEAWESERRKLLERERDWKAAAERVAELENQLDAARRESIDSVRSGEQGRSARERVEHDLERLLKERAEERDFWERERNEAKAQEELFDAAREQHRVLEHAWENERSANNAREKQWERAKAQWEARIDELESELKVSREQAKSLEGAARQQRILQASWQSESREHEAQKSAWEAARVEHQRQAAQWETERRSLMAAAERHRTEASAWKAQRELWSEQRNHIERRKNILEEEHERHVQLEAAWEAERLGYTRRDEAWLSERQRYVEREQAWVAERIRYEEREETLDSEIKAQQLLLDAERAALEEQERAWHAEAIEHAKREAQWEIERSGFAFRQAQWETERAALAARAHDEEVDAAGRPSEPDREGPVALDPEALRAKLAASTDECKQLRAEILRERERYESAWQEASEAREEAARAATELRALRGGGGGGVVATRPPVSAVAARAVGANGAVASEESPAEETGEDEAALMARVAATLETGRQAMVESRSQSWQSNSEPSSTSSEVLLRETRDWVRKEQALATVQRAEMQRSAGQSTDACAQAAREGAIDASGRPQPMAKPEDGAGKSRELQLRKRLRAERSVARSGIERVRRALEAAQDDLLSLLRPRQDISIVTEGGQAPSGRTGEESVEGSDDGSVREHRSGTTSPIAHGDGRKSPAARWLERSRGREPSIVDTAIMLDATDAVYDTEDAANPSYRCDDITAGLSPAVPVRLHPSGRLETPPIGVSSPLTPAGNSSFRRRPQRMMVAAVVPISPPAGRPSPAATEAARPSPVREETRHDAGPEEAEPSSDDEGELQRQATEIENILAGIEALREQLRDTQQSLVSRARDDTREIHAREQVVAAVMRDKATLEEQVVELREQLAALSVELTREKTSEESTLRSLTSLERELVNERAKCASLVETNAALTEKNDSLGEHVIVLNERVTTARAGEEEWRQNCKRTDQELERWRMRCTDIDARLQQALAAAEDEQVQVRGVHEQLARKTADLAELEKEHEQLWQRHQKAREESAQRVADLQMDSVRTSLEMSRGTRKADEERKRAEALAASLAALHAEKDSCERAAQAKLTASESVVASLRDELAETSSRAIREGAKAKNLQAELSVIEGRLAVVTHQLEETRTELASAETRMEEQRKEVAKLRAETDGDARRRSASESEHARTLTALRNRLRIAQRRISASSTSSVVSAATSACASAISGAPSQGATSSQRMRSEADSVSEAETEEEAVTALPDLPMPFSFMDDGTPVFAAPPPSGPDHVRCASQLRDMATLLAERDDAYRSAIETLTESAARDVAAAIASTLARAREEAASAEDRHRAAMAKARDAWDSEHEQALAISLEQAAQAHEGTLLQLRQELQEDTETQLRELARARDADKRAALEALALASETALQEAVSERAQETSEALAALQAEVTVLQEQLEKEREEHAKSLDRLEEISEEGVKPTNPGLGVGIAELPPGAEEETVTERLARVRAAWRRNAGSPVLKGATKQSAAIDITSPALAKSFRRRPSTPRYETISGDFGSIGSSEPSPGGSPVDAAVLAKKLRDQERQTTAALAAAHREMDELGVQLAAAQRTCSCSLAAAGCLMDVTNVLIKHMDASSGEPLDLKKIVSSETLYRDRVKVRLRATEEQESVTLEDAQNHLEKVLRRLRTRAMADMWRKLTEGGLFKKYGRKGKPHAKRVYCDLPSRSVFWTDKGKSPSTRKSIPFSDIRSVVPGHATPVFYNNKTRGPETNCFSLVATERSLDLECDSEAERDIWVETFRVCVLGKVWQEATQDSAAVGAVGRQVHLAVPSARAGRPPVSLNSSQPAVPVVTPTTVRALASTSLPSSVLAVVASAARTSPAPPGVQIPRPVKGGRGDRSGRSRGPAASSSPDDGSSSDE